MTELAQLVQKLRDQQLNDYQIIQTLQQQGHKPKDITQAIEFANKTAPYNTPSEANPMQPPQNPMQMNQMPSTPAPFPPPPQESSDDFEQLIEEIIEEKWNDMKKNIDRIIAWKEQVDTKIGQMSQAQKDLGEQFERVHNAVLGKVGEYDKNIKEVGAQLQAMEKLFSDVLPTFTQNVNTLNRITQKLDKPAPKPKEDNLF